jgi:hypothetical protein
MFVGRSGARCAAPVMQAFGGCRRSRGRQSRSILTRREDGLGSSCRRSPRGRCLNAKRAQRPTPLARCPSHTRSVRPGRSLFTRRLPLTPYVLSRRPSFATPPCTAARHSDAVPLLTRQQRALLRRLLASSRLRLPSRLLGLPKLPPNFRLQRSRAHGHARFGRARCAAR